MLLFHHPYPKAIHLVSFFSPFLFWLHWVFAAACRLSLVAVNAACSPVVARGLLVAAVSLVVGYGSGVHGLS